MMTFQGDRNFPQAPGDLWAKLSDPAFLVECIPDATLHGTVEKNRAACTVRPGVAFVRGSLDVTLEIAEAIPGVSIRLLVTSKGIGSTSDVEATLDFSPHDAGTRVHWKAEVKSLGGLLKAVPAGLIRGAAQKVIADVWAGVDQKLGS
jgi:carbon monoxide dehydrogenase subunit G